MTIQPALPATVANLTKPTRYLAVTETAKLIRQALKEAFPEIRFSIKTSRYSGGSSIRIRWVDGPKASSVEAIAKAFQGGYFDGMTDYTGHHTHTLNGEPVSFGGDFVLHPGTCGGTFAALRSPASAMHFPRPKYAISALN